MPPKKKAEPAKRGRDGSTKGAASKPKSLAQQMMETYLDADAELRDQAQKDFGGDPANLECVQLGLGIDPEEVEDLKSVWEFSSKEEVVESYSVMFGNMHLSKEKYTEALTTLAEKLPMKATAAAKKKYNFTAVNTDAHRAALIAAMRSEILPAMKKVYNPSRLSHVQETPEEKKSSEEKWGKKIVPKAVADQARQFHLAMACFSMIRDMEVALQDEGDDFFDVLAANENPSGEELLETVYDIVTMIRSMIRLDKGWVEEEKGKDMYSAKTQVTKAGQSKSAKEFGISSGCLILLDSLCARALVRVKNSIPEPMSEAVRAFQDFWDSFTARLGAEAKKEKIEDHGTCYLGSLPTHEEDYEEQYDEAKADGEEDTFLQTGMLNACVIKAIPLARDIIDDISDDFASCPWNGLTARGNHVWQCIHQSDARKKKEYKNPKDFLSAVAVVRNAVSPDYDFWFRCNEENDVCADLLFIIDKLLKAVNPDDKWLVEDTASEVEGALKPTKQCVAKAAITLGITSSSCATLARWLKIEKEKVEAIANSEAGDGSEDDNDDDDDDDDEGWETVSEDDE